jgi:hypothetical protein
MKLPFILLNTSLIVLVAGLFSGFFPLSIANDLRSEGVAEQKSIIGKKGVSNFQAFVKLFPARELPYKLGATELNGWIEQRKQKENSGAPMAKQAAVVAISESFGDFIPALNAGRFSRMGPDVFRPEAMLVSTGKNVTIVYSRGRGYSRNFASYYLATYTPKGKRIDEVFIGGSKGYKSFTGCLVTKTQNGNLLVTVQEYDNKWKNDGNYYADDNQIFASPLKASTYKMVASNGAITSVETP